MYKMLIADNEENVIDDLTITISKHFKDKFNIQTAKTGRSVIELADQLKPDIALIDINMPGINGIEAMKEIRANNPSTILIVISAYNKFEYAKEALQLGVLRYINKPVNKQEINDTISLALNKLDYRSKKRKQELNAREKLEYVIPIVENGMIYSILFEKNCEENISQYKELLNISQDYAYMMVLQCGAYAHLFSNNFEDNIRIQNHYSLIKNILKERFESCIVGTMMGSVISILVPYCQVEGEEIYKLQVKTVQTAHSMVKKLNNILKAQFRIAIGSVKPIANAKESYNEAVNSLSFTRGSVAHINDLPIKNNYDPNYPLNLENALLEAVEAGNINLALHNVSKFFDWMVTNYSDRELDIKIKVLEFVLRSENIGFKSQRLEYHFTARSDYLSTIMEIHDYSTLLNWFQDKIKETCRNIVNHKEENNKNTIKKAIDYIQHNFRKDISLDDVSEYVQISPYYFSKLFKKEQNVNFIDYLTKVRISEAKKLLSEQQNLSVKEICRLVGYSNPNYFSRSFKKHVGLSPTEYKESLHS